MSKRRTSLDEIMSHRQFSVKSTEKGDVLTKVYKAPASWNEESRSAKFIMTAEVKDRYGDVVVAKGGKLDDFNGNPVGLWAHNSRALPIGMWSDVKYVSGQPKRMEGVITLAPDGTTPEADSVARLLSAGMVRACSIGFIPLEWEALDKDDPWGGYKFLEWELLECSICSVPANPAALAKAAGGDSGLALQAIELVLDQWARTPEGIIVPREAYERAYQRIKANDVTLHEVRAVADDDATDEVDAPSTEEIRGLFEGLGALFEKLVSRKSKSPAPTVVPDEVEEDLERAGQIEAQRAIDEEAARVAAEEEAEAERKRLAEEEEAAKAADLLQRQRALELRARAALVGAAPSQ